MDRDNMLTILDSATKVIRQIQFAERELKKLPNGSIVMHNIRHNAIYPYLHYSENGIRKQKILPRKQEELTSIKQALALSRQYKAEIKEGNKYLTDNAPLFHKLYTTIEKNYHYWANHPLSPQPSQHANHKEYLIHITSRGERVRSRAEVIVADSLAANRIPYQYEKKLTLNGHDVYPDFTLIHPLTGKTFLIEYCGMNTAEYEEKLAYKTAAYTKAGYIEGIHILYIREEDGWVDSSKINKLIRSNFTLERYTLLKQWLQQNT